MEQFFSYDSRLGIPVPDLTKDWQDYSVETQEKILFSWEQIRGAIPDRIIELETLINERQGDLSNESSFSRSCELNTEIAELASIINDLWLWYRAGDNALDEKPQD
ncbi:hypothetical protein D1B31_11175 [Neobacillus notoginsengisoli]|uniref:Radical SAM protein n=1 Tax=Neobacillus notoginsengisoli TaxID=1578198 RepID=A0A417YU79_9BACI|nr:hypothetical protein [Neobacillus notoginsengisoli]RHW40744.1 hypothetical protein D1B31_11175 [Neobacillus notoginsengisoli]